MKMQDDFTEKEAQTEEFKHFKICIRSERHRFEFRCSTISEAYDAVQDASMAFGIDADMNRIMAALVDMNRGKTISYRHSLLLMEVGKGEV